MPTLAYKDVTLRTNAQHAGNQQLALVEEKAEYEVLDIGLGQTPSNIVPTIVHAHMTQRTVGMSLDTLGMFASSKQAPTYTTPYQRDVSPTDRVSKILRVLGMGKDSIRALKLN